VNPLARIAGFAAAVAVLSGGAAVAGGAIDPRGADENPAAAHETNTHGGESMASKTAHSAHDVRGLAVADEGLRVVVTDSELRRGESERLSFAIVDAHGDPVRDFEVEHERRMHLILVRRDLTGFQHLHPELGDDGRWTTDVRLDEAGSYRLFADFARGGESHTLAADLRVDGDADLRPLPEPDPVATTNTGYEVRLDSGAAHAGEEADLRFTISRDGQEVDVEPYLGANGHLVALRDGDLAFLHVHPHGDDVAFAATFPTTGSYRLFLQFKHDGRVHTAAFTQVVD
jgi:hypothetical protein